MQLAGVLYPDRVIPAHRVPGDSPGLGPFIVAQVPGLMHVAQHRFRQHGGLWHRIGVGADLKGQPPGQIGDAPIGIREGGIDAPPTDARSQCETNLGSPDSSMSFGRLPLRCSGSLRLTSIPKIRQVLSVTFKLSSELSHVH